MSPPADELQHLRKECERMLKDQDSWKPEDLPKDFVLALMHRCVETTPRKGVSTDLIAAYCDLFGPWSPGGWKATYKRIAAWSDKSPEAVRKAHNRSQKS